MTPEQRLRVAVGRWDVRVREVDHGDLIHVRAAVGRLLDPIPDEIKAIGVSYPDGLDRNLEAYRAWLIGGEQRPEPYHIDHDDHRHEV